ncbi:MAG: hypothetical protein WCR72_13245, partial [Bacteroidota bacterium]
MDCIPKNNYLIISTLAFLFLLNPGSVLAQKQDMMRISKLAARVQSYHEGFIQNTGTNDFTYPSLRDDATSGLLTRCTDGTMAIEWKTDSLPQEISNQGEGFLWMATVDHTTEGKKFGVFINDKLRFTYISSGNQEMEFRNSEGGILGFTRISTDLHGDYQGYMWAELPKDWLLEGKPQKIKIVGQTEGSNFWIIVYQIKDALRFLLNSAKYSTWSQLTAKPAENGIAVDFKAPVTKAGENIYISFGKENKVLQLAAANECSITTFSLPKSILGQSFSIKDQYGKILVQPEFGKTGEQTLLTSNSLLRVECTNMGGLIQIQTFRTYKPATVESLAALALSPAAKGSIYLMNSSHQDIAWMDS